MEQFRVCTEEEVFLKRRQIREERKKGREKERNTSNIIVLKESLFPNQEQIRKRSTD